MERTMLEGGCFVVDPVGLEHTRHGSWQQAVVVDRERGAIALSQFTVSVRNDAIQARRFPDADCVVFVVAGRGVIDIGGNRFGLSPECGAYVRPGEAFRIIPADGAIDLLLTVCPQCEEAEWLDCVPAGFDENYPQRVVPVDEQKREATGDRFFQVLADASIGSKQITQFIGIIPPSKAPQHFHNYEEVITVLSGKGLMWAGEQCTPIRAGSMIYLPRKQSHCLQCQHEKGMHLIGHFYPAGSPAVRY